jgi:transcriptional regulator with XRE-family HTH domain
MNPAMNRIKELRQSRNLTQAQLAEMIGTTDATIQRLETGRRQLTERWAVQISTVLGVDVSEVFGQFLPAAAAGLSVIGEVQAGVWRETDVSDEPKHPPLPLGHDPRYQGKRQFALLVQGESMNKVFAPGTFIVCVAWSEIGRQPREGDIVVVERRRDGMVETTVKRIAIQSRKLVLMPDSTDPRFQNPIELEGSIERDEIVITALVVGRYEQL